MKVSRTVLKTSWIGRLIWLSLTIKGNLNMKTNQIMHVNIGNEHSITIGHLTNMSSLNDVLAIGNSYRRNKGMREIELSEWLRKESTWEFIMEVEEMYGNSPKCLNGILETSKTNDGKIEYAKLIKQFTVIKSQRGGKLENRGVWANLQILFDLAIYMSPTLRLEMIDVFIKGKILEWRYISGDEFKSLNIAIDDLLPGREGKTSNKGIYINIAKMLNLRILGEKGSWNDASSDQLNLRANLEGKLISYLEMGFIRDWEHLKEVINTIPIPMFQL